MRTEEQRESADFTRLPSVTSRGQQSQEKHSVTSGSGQLYVTGSLEEREDWEGSGRFDAQDSAATAVFPTFDGGISKPTQTKAPEL